MELGDLLREAIKENENKEFYDGDFVTWLLKKRRITDLITVVNNSKVLSISLKKAYCGKKSIYRLENSDDIVTVATLVGTMGYVKEAQEIFDAIILRTPNDTTALNNYGYVLMQDMISKKQKYAKNKILIAQRVITKAAAIDQFLQEEPHNCPIYKNLCFLRAVEAEYYVQNGAYLPAFLIAWMSVEMSIYRIFYHYLKEKKYDNGNLFRLNVDSIIEILFVNKYDPKFIESRAEFKTLRSLRNHLIHGDIFEVSECDAKRCINLAYALTLVKEDFRGFLTDTQARIA